MAYKCGSTPQVGDLVVRDSKHPHNKLGELHHKVVHLRGNDILLEGIDDTWYADRFNLVSRGSVPGTNPATQGVSTVNKIEDPVKTAEKAAAELLKQAEATATKLVADAEEAAAKAAAEKEKLDHEAAVSARLENEKALASATSTLLADIGAVRVGANVTQRGVYAKFRNELNPLAQSYGYKLVLVGDKTQGVLVVA